MTDHPYSLIRRSSRSETRPPIRTCASVAAGAGDRGATRCEEATEILEEPSKDIKRKILISLNTDRRVGGACTR
jgi:hypothetical protein